MDKQKNKDMKRVKECYEVLINGKYTLIQVIRNEKKEERNVDGTINNENWCKIIDDIMIKYFNTDSWMFDRKEDNKTINIRLKI